MAITVKYLASLAEELGKSEEQFTAEDSLSVLDIWQQLNPDVTFKANTLCAVNFEYVTANDRVADGVELAFFPPVTGG